MNFRPRLTLIETPQLSNYRFDPIRLRESRGYYNGVDGQFSLTYTVLVKNVGTATARLVAQVLADTLTGKPALREMLTDSKARQALHFVATSDFYPLREIAPGDTAEFTFPQTLSGANDSQGTFHMLLLYENDAGALYDTYYWARYSLSPMWAKGYWRLGPNGYEPEISLDGDTLRNALRLVDTNESSFLYSATEAREIRQYARVPL